MSSMRNAVQRRNHKERAQPKEREKWGILEKHKDYSLRAKDYNAKKQRLKLLRQKAAERNPDEFHFAMMSSRTDAAGRKIADRGNRVLDHDTAKLLKTQDAGYLRTMAQKTRIARERLEQEILLSEHIGTRNSMGTQTEDQDMEGVSSRVVFVDSEAAQRRWGETDSADDGPEPAHSESRAPHSNDQRLDDDDDEDEDEDEDFEGEQSRTQADQRTMRRKSKMEEGLSLKDARYQRKKRRRVLEAKQSMLEALRAREKSLLAAQRELEVQRARMNNTMGGATKSGMKFTIRERKK